MKKLIILVFICILFTGIASAAYNISGIIYDDVTGEPLHNVKFYSENGTVYGYSNNSGHFNLTSVIDSNVYAYKNGYSVLLESYDVLGSDVAGEELYMELNQETMMVTTYNILIVILAACFYIAFPPRGKLTPRDTGILNISAAFMGICCSAILAFESISGNMYMAYEHGPLYITNGPMFYLFTCAMVIMFGMLALDIFYYYKQRS